MPGSGNADELVFRWAGEDDKSTWISAAKIRPGNTIIVPACIGGVDQFGWNPNAKPATDVADEAAASFAGRRFVVRVAPGLLKNPADEIQFSQALASADTHHWEALRDAVKGVGLPDALAKNLDKLDLAKGKKRRNKVEVYTELYGNEDGCPRGVVFVAPFGIDVSKSEEAEECGCSNATEDDIAGSLPGFTLSLERHSKDIEEMIERFLKRIWQVCRRTVSQTSNWLPICTMRAKPIRAFRPGWLMATRWDRTRIPPMRFSLNRRAPFRAMPR